MTPIEHRVLDTLLIDTWEEIKRRVAHTIHWSVAVEIERLPWDQTQLPILGKVRGDLAGAL